ncbi:MAG: lactonase family protein [Planctomycetota bacterium]
MRQEWTSVLAIIALTAGCAKHKSHTFLPGTALAPSLSSSTTNPPIPTTETSPPTTPTPPVLEGGPEARFLYVANPAAGTVSQLAFDSSRGNFASVGAPVLTGGSYPWALAVDPVGRFLYCANRGSNDVSCFTIDPESGGLKLVPAGAPRSNPTKPKLVDKKVYSTPFFTIRTLVFEVPGGPSESPATVTASTGAAPSALAVSPDGTRLVVLNRFDGSLGSYRIDRTTGQLTPAHLMVFDNNQTPSDLAFDPEGGSFFVCCGPRGFVGRVKIHQAGLMKQAGPVLGVGRSPVALAVSPKGDKVVVATHPDDTVWTLVVGADGKLAHKDKVKVQGDPSAIAFGPTGETVYVTAKHAAKLFAYSFNAKGKLGPDGSPVSTGAAPTGLAVDQGGGLVYTANVGDRFISLFELDPITRNPGVGKPVEIPAPASQEAAPGPGARSIVAVR